VTDASFRHGEGLFETLRARGARPFRPDRHLGRLLRSAEHFGWSLPWSETELAGEVKATLEANGHAESRVRLQVTPGTAGLDHPSGPPLLLVEAVPFVPVDEALRARGVAVEVASRRVPAGGTAKSCSYLDHLLARRAARAAGSFEAILLNADGEVCEAAMANLFAVARGVLRTPPEDAGALAGITREAVLELAAADRGIEIREERFGPRGLADCGELFLTSTGIEVLPVVQVDGAAVGDGKPGPITLELARRYRRLLDEELGGGPDQPGEPGARGS
jgi:branched-chain amino acid aminotransferase